MPSIKVCSWNANGLRPKLGELKEFINRLNIDIMLLNETKLEENNSIKIKNFQIIRRDRTANRGGVAIIISDKIGYKLCPLNHQISVECICIKLLGNIYLVAAYNEPRNKISQQDISTLTNLGDRVLIIGDLNARHNTWNNHINNTNGRTLYNYVQNSNVIVQHPNRPTHYPENGMTPTCIHIVINKKVPNASEPISMGELSSDHNPIILELQNQFKDFSQKSIRSYKDTDWQSFRKSLDQNIIINNKIKSSEDIERELKIFTEQIIKTQSEHSRIIKLGQNSLPLDGEIKTLIRIRNSLRKQYQRTYWQHLKNDINRLNQVIRTKTRACVNQNWEKTLENIKPGDRTLWRITKAFRNKQVKIPTIAKDDRNYFSDKGKANLNSE